MNFATGFLHPGAMGSTVAAQCSGERWWAGQGRSDDSRRRAEAAGLQDAHSVEELVERVDLIVSICPPHSALEVAQSVAKVGFSGVYVDANAISPERSRAIANLFDRFVDGSIIGPPARTAGTTRMYLAGSDIEPIASRWSAGHLDVRTVGERIGAASALKMAYAGWTKGTSAMLLGVAALADAHGVGEVLRSEWEISQPHLTTRISSTAAAVGAKAWRFDGEMAEIAATMESVDLPAGFHEAAAELFRRLANLKHATDVDLDAVLKELLPPEHR